jgi:hypothetical protein
LLLLFIVAPRVGGLPGRAGAAAFFLTGGDKTVAIGEGSGL